MHGAQSIRLFKQNEATKGQPQRRFAARLALTLLALILFNPRTPPPVQAQDNPPPQDISIEELQALIDQKGYHWTAGETSVSRLAPDERRRLLGLAVDGKLAPADDALCSVSNYPDTYPPSLDWRNRYGYNWTTAIRNQKGCGSCAAFAANGAIESRLKIAYADPGWQPDLSESHLFFCSWGNCTEGWSPMTALVDSQSRGIADEACFPYQDYDQPCNPCADWENRVTKIDCYRQSNGAARIKQDLADYGPLITSMSVYADFYAYRSGIYAHTSGGYEGGHAVTLVGYNDAGGYWIAKNSWGSANWGEDGWFRIAYGECGFGEYGYVPVIDRIPPGQVSDLRPWGWNGPYTNDPSPAFAWTQAHDDWGGVGLDGYYIAIDDPTPEGGSGNDWSIDLATSWHVPVDLPDGSHFVALTSRDKVGNINPANTNKKGDAIYYDFVVDTTPPANPTHVNSGCEAQDGVWQTACSQPTFTWSGADDHGGSGVQDYHIYWGTAPAGSLNDRQTDPAYTPPAIGVNTAVITYYLRLATRDNLDQESEPETVFTLLYDAAPPWGGFNLNDGQNLAYAQQVRVTPVGNDAGSGVTTVRLSNDGENWQTLAYAPGLDWELPFQDHTMHTVYLRLADGAGTLSPIYTQSICLDMTPPAPHSSGYRLWSAGIVAGGAARASARFRLNATLGQAIGQPLATGAHYRLQSGFQATWTATETDALYTPFTCGAPARSIYLPLTLRSFP